MQPPQPYPWWGVFLAFLLLARPAEALGKEAPEGFPDELWCSVCKISMKHAARKLWGKPRTRKIIEGVLHDDFCAGLVRDVEDPPPPILEGCKTLMEEPWVEHAVQGLLEDQLTKVSDPSALAVKACMADVGACDSPVSNEWDKMFGRKKKSSGADPPAPAPSTGTGRKKHRKKKEHAEL